MTKFICTGCNYRFEAETIRNRCPYCGKERIVREPDAEELLKEN